MGAFRAILLLFSIYSVSTVPIPGPAVPVPVPVPAPISVPAPEVEVPAPAPAPTPSLPSTPPPLPTVGPTPTPSPDPCLDVDCTDFGGDMCEKYTCEDGACVRDPGNDVVCDGDNDFCKVNWRCDPTDGSCIFDERECDDQEFCTMDWCDVGMQECASSYSPNVCGDDLCMLYVCEPDYVDEGLGPAGAETQCKAYERKCDDFEECTTDTCDAGTGECTYEVEDPLCANENVCINDHTFTDSNGHCDKYEEFPMWCDNAAFFVRPGERSAQDACCVCGGGFSDDLIECDFEGPYDDVYLRDYACEDSTDYETIQEAKTACCECNECTGIVHRRDDIDGQAKGATDHHFHIRKGDHLRKSHTGERVWRKDSQDVSCPYTPVQHAGAFIRGHVDDQVPGCEPGSFIFPYLVDAEEACCGCDDCGGVTCRESEMHCQMRQGPQVVFGYDLNEFSHTKDVVVQVSCSFNPEEPDTFYGLYACEDNIDNRMFLRLEDAQEACCLCGDCRAVTLEASRDIPKYTLRRGSTPEVSPSGETSWEMA